MDVSAADLRRAVAKVLTGADLAKMTLRTTMAALVKHYGVADADLAPRKAEVREFIGDYLQSLENANNDDDSDDEEDSDDSDDEETGLVEQDEDEEHSGTEEPPPKPRGKRKAPAASSSAAAGKGRKVGKKRRRTAETESEGDDGDSADDDEEEEEDVKWKPVRLSGLSKAVILDDPLAKLCGSKVMARAHIQREIIAYVKKHELQDDKDKRTIHSDNTLRSIFKVDQFTFFGLSKLISDHVSKPEDAGEELQRAAEQKDATTLEEMQAERERKIANGEKPRGSGTRRKKAAPTRTTRVSAEVSARRASGLNAPMHLSDELIAVCGGESVLTRPQVVKALWAYIKENNLKDPKDGRQIRCDEKLSAIFDGESSVSGFGMNKYLSAHLTRVSK